MSYICISHASEDSGIAEKLYRELTSYGFRVHCIHENTLADKRERRFGESKLLLLLTSPAAADTPACARDLRRAAASGKLCVCVSLGENLLDKKYCAMESAIPMVAYPAVSDAEIFDERSRALLMHRLYVRHLAPLTDTFSPARDAEDIGGWVIRTAVAAYRGDREAQYALGCAYEEGRGLPVISEDAALWISQAADNDHTQALVRMGELYLDGKGVEKDTGEALRLFSRAARLGDAAGQFAKGICCLYGYGLMKDPEMARRYFGAAAQDGYVPALYRMGLLYRDGLGVEKNDRKALWYFYRAATAKDPIPAPLYGIRFSPTPNGEKKKKYVCVTMRFMAQKKLNRLIRQKQDSEEARFGGGHTSLEKDATHTFCKHGCHMQRANYPEDGWLERVATTPIEEYTGDYSHRHWNPAQAENALGLLLEHGSASAERQPSPYAALYWYRRAAQHGHLGALIRLGDIYRSGRGLPKDSCHAVSLFHCAATKGSRRGQFAMGVCCERGEGIPKNGVAAVAWYEQAAKRGYAPAQNNLGGCYESGIGVEPDILAAVEYYTKASAEGEPNATCRLGLCYENGVGVMQSPEKAFRLYENAAKHGHPVALYRMALYYDRGFTLPTQVAYAAHLYERAAKAGMGDAAYAMALCCEEGRGVQKNPEAVIEWLRIASERGSVQGAYALGMAYYEGRLTVKNLQAAEKALRRAAELYDAMSTRAREDGDRLYPMDGLSLTAAAGKAWYMLGYFCVLEDRAFDAKAHFEHAAFLGCGEAMTALGDLYAYGYLSSETPEAINREIMAAYEAAGKAHQIEALLSLATRYEAMAAEAAQLGQAQIVNEKRIAAFNCLTQGADQGSAYALVGVAGCYWLGYGVEKNKNQTFDILRRLGEGRILGRNGTPKRNTLSDLWFGDLCLIALEKESSSEQKQALLAKKAYQAYTHATAAPYMDSEGWAYVLPARRDQRRISEGKAKAEAQYRLAILCMTHLAGKVSAEEILAHLGEAVLAEHSTALDDLTRLFLWEKHSKAKREGERTGKKIRKKSESLPAQTAEFLASFGKMYYATLRLLPEPFKVSPPVITRKTLANTLPDILKAPLTPTLRAEALNRLGDRYFYGQDIREDHAAALTCYRRAASVTQPRGEAVSGGIVWAQYSLGYCLLHGIGTHKDAREAVRWLTKAAKYHGKAALCLAECHLDGVGVDRKDRLEALKYYRRALKFGITEIEDTIRRLEAELREES